MYSLSGWFFGVEWPTGWWLRVSKFNEGEQYGECELDGHEYAACFGFRSQVHEVIYRVAHDVYGFVVHCVGVFGGFLVEDVPGGGAVTFFW